MFRIVVKAPALLQKARRRNAVRIIQVFRHPYLTTYFHGPINFPVAAIDNGVVVDIGIEVRLLRNAPIDVFSRVIHSRSIIHKIGHIFFKLRNFIGIIQAFEILAD